MKKTQLITVAIVLLAVAATTSPCRAQHTVQLTWAASSDATASPTLTYNVYRSASCTDAFARLNIAPVSTPSYQDTSVLPATYCYQVTSVLSGVESAPSNQAEAIIRLQASAQSGCTHRGNLIGWIRCAVARPVKKPRSQPLSQPTAQEPRHREAAAP
ncbi:MAG: hypothetical protein ACRD4Q_07470 [Candidatus Acidiferrales bacterium]